MAKYQIQFHGHLDQRWKAMFPTFTILHQMVDDKPVTLMIGEVSDQAALFGLINRLRNMGIELISFQPQNDEALGNEENE